MGVRKKVFVGLVQRGNNGRPLLAAFSWLATAASGFHAPEMAEAEGLDMAVLVDAAPSGVTEFFCVLGGVF